MARFLALTSKGLGGVLEKEFKDANFKVLKASQSRTLFECNWEKLYLAHLILRSATRILMPILDFTAYQNEELYGQVKRHDFTKYIEPHQSLAVVTHLAEEPGPFANSMYVSQLVKDAIVDQFREKFGKRPNVDKKNAQLEVWVRIKGPQVSLSIDLTGKTLSHRGYRPETGEAPLREHIAAGLIELTQWQGERDLVDPMCGSGTFLIEAAMISMKQAPGTFRKHFAFMDHKIFQNEAWEKAVQQAMDQELEQPRAKIMGYDIDPRVVEIARKNIENAGLEDHIQVEQRAIKDLKNPGLNSPLIVCNPPYGERLKTPAELENIYSLLGSVLKEQFKGAEAWILSGNRDLTPALRMKSERSYSVDNNGIECKWLKYNLFVKEEA